MHGWQTTTSVRHARRWNASCRRDHSPAGGRSDAEPAPGPPDRERDAEGGLDVDEQGVARGAERRSGEFLGESDRVQRWVAPQLVQGDIEQRAVRVETADVVL